MKTRIGSWVFVGLLVGCSFAATACELIVGNGGYTTAGDGGGSSGSSGTMDDDSGGGSGSSSGNGLAGSGSGSGSGTSGTGDGGSSSGSAGATAALGDPCTLSAQCKAGTCNGEWCTAACTSDTSCGVNSTGQPGRCVENADMQDKCFPGCSSTTDCAAYAGTTCQTGVDVAGGTVSDCAGLIPLLDPCTNDSDCVSGSCTGAWCTMTCTSDATCGTSASGMPGRCLTNGAGQDVCFPGCTTSGDCGSYRAATCQTGPDVAGASTSVCAALIALLDPCTVGSDCASGDCTGTWCTTTCTSDAMCGKNSAGVAGRCVGNTSDQFSCFPGCTTASDCASYTGTVCHVGTDVAGGTVTGCASN